MCVLVCVGVFLYVSVCVLLCVLVIGCASFCVCVSVLKCLSVCMLLCVWVVSLNTSPVMRVRV